MNQHRHPIRRLVARLFGLTVPPDPVSPVAARVRSWTR